MFKITLEATMLMANKKPQIFHLYIEVCLPLLIGIRFGLPSSFCKIYCENQINYKSQSWHYLGQKTKRS